MEKNKVTEFFIIFPVKGTLVHGRTESSKDWGKLLLKITKFKNKEFGKMELSKRKFKHSRQNNSKVIDNFLNKPIEFSKFFLK